MTDQVIWIKRLNQRIIENLSSERSLLLKQLEEIKKRSDEIQSNLDILDAKKDQLLSAEKLQIELLSSTGGFNQPEQDPVDLDAEQEDMPDSSGPVREIGKLKARIGDQRYLVLEAFRQARIATIHFVIFRTQLPERRVRDAVVADLSLGVLEKRAMVLSGEDAIALTEVGQDLMRRYDDYRRQKGLPLPVLPDLSKAPNPIGPDGEPAEAHEFL